MERVPTELGHDAFTWRVVPTDNSSLGKSAVAVVGASQSSNGSCQRRASRTSWRHPAASEHLITLIHLLPASLPSPQQCNHSADSRVPDHAVPYLLVAGMRSCPRCWCQLVQQQSFAHACSIDVNCPTVC